MMVSGTRTRRTALVVAVGVLALLMTMAASRVGAQSLDDYPDLVADPPEAIQDPEEITWNGEDMLVVTFDGFVTNVGGGALHVEGNPQPSAFGTAGAVAQHILDGSGSSIAEFPLDTAGANPAVEYENSDGHEHWHLMRIMQYSLWDETKTAQVTPGSKIGFCLWDIERIAGSEPGVYNGGGNWCAGNGYSGGGPTATFLQMGVSSGWRDTYNRFISLQWVDVSEVAPGNYYMAALADPNDIVEEADETNNSHVWVDTLTVVPGYNATDVDAGTVDVPTVITLTSETFGSAGTREFVIESMPTHGTLDVAAGTPFTGTSITYTPDAGYSGPDSFTYYAYDADADYPTNRSAHTATVIVDVDGNTAPSVTNPGDQTSSVGEDVSLQIVATDAESDTLTYGAVELPNGLTMDSSTGLISGQVADAQSPWGTIVSVDDGLETAQVSFNWTVVDSTPPSVSIDQPTDGETVAAVVGLAASASDDVGVVSVEFLVDGGSVGVDGDGTDGWSLDWDSATVSDGSHDIEAVASDAAGLSSTHLVSVTVDNVTEPPPAVCEVVGSQYEAEAGVLAGRFSVGSDAAASGGSFVHVGSGGGASAPGGDFVEFCFTVAAAGEYTLDALVDGPDGGSNSFFVTVDDAPAGGYLWDVAAGFVSDRVSDRNAADPVVLDLAAGDHVVRVFLREDGTRLDALTLVAVSGPPPAVCEVVGSQYEAEAGVLAGRFSVGSDAAASGGSFVHVGSGGGASAPGGDFVEFCFTVAAAGEYTLDALVDGPDGGSNSFFVTVDDAPAGGYLWDVAAGFVSDRVSDRNAADPVVLDLAAGDHVVRVFLREDGTRLDALTLVAVSGPPPAVCEVVGSQYEAEAGVLAGRFSVGSDAAASGGSFVHVGSGGGASAPGGDFVEFCFTVAAAGDYVLDASVNGIDSGSDSFFLTVDGGPAAGYLWDIPGGWTTDQVSDRSGQNPIVLTLDPGDHVVAVHLREDGAQLDWLTLNTS